MSDQKITRRDLLRTTATVGVGGVVAGGIVGYLAGAAGGGQPAAPAAPASGTTTDTGGAAPAPAGPPEDIRAVGIFPLGGFIAADGQEMRNGAVMAIDEINAMGGLLGRKIQYIEIDDKDSLAEDVTTAFQRAVDVEKPDVIFSGYHLASGPEFDIVANAGALYYNVNTQERWTDLYQKDPGKYWSIFQCDPNDTWYGGGFALWLDKLVKAGAYNPANKTAAILSGDDAYDAWIAQNFESKIKELGWTVSVKESFTVGNVADWGPLLSKVRDNPPGILFTTDYNPADNAAMAKQWAANPLNCLVYQQYGPSVPEYMDLAGEAANGIIWATVLGLLTDPVGNDFRQRYQAKFGQAPGWANAGGCYDEVWVWAKAAALSGDPKNYKQVAAMTEKLVHRGVTGSISFINHAGVQYPEQTPDPSLGQPHIIVQIQNKQHRVVSPAPYTDGTFQLPPWFKA